MFQNTPITKELDFQNTKIILQTGLLAQQANSAVLATMGETTVLAAVVIGKETTSDYFPLQVVYEERLYASGKIKGSRFIKREGRPSENAILTGRMIDRSLRSLFDSKIRIEVQVVVTVLSLDEVHSPDLLSVLAASSALKIAIEDFQGPVSSVRIGKIKSDPAELIVSQALNHISKNLSWDDILPILQDACGFFELHKDEDKASFRQIFDALVKTNTKWANELKSLYQQSNRDHKDQIVKKYSQQSSLVVCPSYEQLTNSELDLVISGDGHNIMMVEAGAKIVDESVVGEGLELASKALTILTNFQNEFINQVRIEANKKAVTLVKKSQDPRFFQYWSNFNSKIEETLYNSTIKEERNNFIKALKSEHLEIFRNFVNFKKSINSSVNSQAIENQNILENLIEGLDLNIDYSENFELGLEDYVHYLVHKNILDNDKRLDGRPLDQTRKISCQVSVLPRVHGSSLFQRGETQVLNILTLGTTRDAQLLDDMEDFAEQTKRYIHHYNFPQYSVGETGRYSGPGRREIGHGALAEKALLPVLPSEEEFPYTIRLVSECLGSNGSTSMASTCGSCLSLLDAGVPIKDLVAGVAMGLVLDSTSGKFKVLTDILGDEDHFGDMDFKVTGTKDGITAIQLDNKVAGLTTEILKQALDKAKIGRMHILGIMREAISEPRKEVSKYAPSVVTLNIPVDKIGEVIGPSGKIIKSLIAKYNVDIDIEDGTGKTCIYGKDRVAVKNAHETILYIIKEYKSGDVVTGAVFRIENYGAFIKIDGTEKEAMIHISQFSTKRIEDINTVVKMGQQLTAKVLEINDKGQLSLTLK